VALQALEKPPESGGLSLPERLPSGLA
jgi:hypothetical protein